MFEQLRIRMRTDGWIVCPGAEKGRVKRVVGQPPTTDRARQLGVIDVGTPLRPAGRRRCRHRAAGGTGLGHRPRSRPSRHLVTPQMLIADVGSRKTDVAGLPRRCARKWAPSCPAHPGTKWAWNTPDALYMDRQVILHATERTLCRAVAARTEVGRNWAAASPACRPSRMTSLCRREPPAPLLAFADDSITGQRGCRHPVAGRPGFRLHPHCRWRSPRSGATSCFQPRRTAQAVQLCSKQALQRLEQAMRQATRSPDMLTLEANPQTWRMGASAAETSAARLTQNWAAPTARWPTADNAHAVDEQPMFSTAFS